MTEKFWTITSEYTSHTNDRSTRFATKQVAIEAAASRLASISTLEGVIVLEAVSVVRRVAPLVMVEPIK